jgi:hypothetical protein
MRGTFVIARTYNGRPLVLRVWDCGLNVIYLSEESQFQQLSTGRRALSPVGFPAEDVFTYDPEKVKDLENGAVEWNSLTRFECPVTAFDGVTGR